MIYYTKLNIDNCIYLSNINHIKCKQKASRQKKRKAFMIIFSYRKRQRLPQQCRPPAPCRLLGISPLCKFPR